MSNFFVSAFRSDFPFFRNTLRPVNAAATGPVVLTKMTRVASPIHTHPPGDCWTPPEA